MGRRGAVGRRGALVARGARDRDVAGSTLLLARLWRCALGQGISPTCALSRPRSKWVPGRTVTDYVID